jgi:hypothetical protein
LPNLVQHFHVSRDTIERWFRWEIDEGRSGGQVRIRGKLFQTAMNGSQRALEVFAANLCGWSLNKPEVQAVTNLIQNAQPQRSPEEVKRHLCEPQRAVLEECRRFDQEQLPPPA